jgi:hypothetical protein
MNCKPGDLARIVSSPEMVLLGYADKIIKVIEFSGQTMAGDSAWTYEPPLLRCPCGCGLMVYGFADHLLRPIRGTEGDDETLAWAGKPDEISTPIKREAADVAV